MKIANYNNFTMQRWRVPDIQSPGQLLNQQTVTVNHSTIILTRNWSSSRSFCWSMVSFLKHVASPSPLLFLVIQTLWSNQNFIRRQTTSRLFWMSKFLKVKVFESQKFFESYLHILLWWEDSIQPQQIEDLVLHPRNLFYFYTKSSYSSLDCYRTNNIDDNLWVVVSYL